MSHYKDGMCYPNGAMGMSEHPAGLAKVGLTGGQKKTSQMSHEAMLPKGEIAKASAHHSHRSKS